MWSPVQSLLFCTGEVGHCNLTLRHGYHLASFTNCRQTAKVGLDMDTTYLTQQLNRHVLVTVLLCDVTVSTGQVGRNGKWSLFLLAGIVCLP